VAGNEALRFGAVVLACAGNATANVLQRKASLDSHHPLARRVKLADLADNLRNNRRLESTSGVRARISRYEAAQHFLEVWSRAV